MPTCDILLAAYNGANYAAELMDSLVSQTTQDFRLIVRDDGSSDNTREIIQNYAGQFGERLVFLPDSDPSGSAKGNYSKLMEASDADYVLFADIDDVWLPFKVDITLKLLKDAEGKIGADKPVYVLTDVAVVDEKLRLISESYWKFKRINPSAAVSLPRSLVCATILGCASGINRTLLKMATPVPDGVTGHDWWAQLLAVCFGVVVADPRRTLLYRQHASNLSAPKRVSASSYLGGSGQFAYVRRGMRLRRQQAFSVLEKFGPALRDEHRKAIEAFVRTGDQGFWARRFSMMRHGVRYPDLTRTLAMYIAM
jgi:glycosyltransferase involved in cell wall biosynthesis